MKFHNSTGTLTTYAFACGYIERKETPALRLDLWHEGACYHVRAHNFNEGARLFWQSFDRLTDARAFYRRQARALNLTKAAA